MKDETKLSVSRRRFLKKTGTIAAASTLAASKFTLVHAADDNTIQMALIGCGGRGSGAAADALHLETGRLKLVAMADVFEFNLSASYQYLLARFGDRVDVPAERRLVGFEQYKQAMDCLKPGDIAILATPPAFRWMMFKYAIEKGLHVFMEKPVSVDGPSSRRMFELGIQAKEKNLKVAVGLMCRHCDARNELHKRISDGEIGEIVTLRSYRMVGPTGSAASTGKPDDMSEVLFQIKRFHSFLWASGGAFSDFLIHNIDECCWMKNAWPIEAKASGGRHYRGDFIDQNFDTYSVEYSFEDGSKLLLNGRTIAGCYNEFSSYAHGTKGSAVISTSAHTPAKCKLYSSQKMISDNLTWRYDAIEPSPYQLEWKHFIVAIRDDLPHQEAERGVKASLVTSMGRMAAHTGQVVTYNDILNCEHEFAPDIENLAADGRAPVMPDAEGKYPVPEPGLKRTREY